MNDSYSLTNNPDHSGGGGHHSHDVAAIVLAAGLSRRMGRPKMFLPWGKTTVIQKVVQELEYVGLPRILVVAGGYHKEMELALEGSRAELIINPEYAKTEMLVSFQTGLRYLLKDNTLDNRKVNAALVVLGDQPQIEAQVIQSILSVYTRTGKEIIVPSFQNRRGHPWLVSRALWLDILSMPADQSLRTFLNRNNGTIHYIECNCPSILKDLDTLQDWENERPG
jgi:molybdenum cofactor cytidylyltransferase